MKSFTVPWFSSKPIGGGDIGYTGIGFSFWSLEVTPICDQPLASLSTATACTDRNTGWFKSLEVPMGPDFGQV